MTHVQTLPNVPRKATRVRGLVLLWRRCYMFCTSGFVGDVMFPVIGDESKVYLQSDSSEVGADRLPCFDNVPASLYS